MKPLTTEEIALINSAKTAATGRNLLYDTEDD